MKIENEKLEVSAAFKNYIYEIPDYQREYVWKDKNVSQLLDDIYEEYLNDKTSEYFIGSIVVTESKGLENAFEVIDGQQRLTTLFLVLCAFKKLFKGIDEDYSNIINGILFSPMINSKGEKEQSYKILLQYEDSKGLIESINDEDVIQANLRNSSKRIYGAYLYALDFLRDNFLNDGADQLKSFYGYFSNKVNFIQIKTPTISDALKIFETINERGIGLNPMDLLKNLMFRQIPREKFKELNNNWRDMVDILDKAKEKKLRFMRYFLMANYDTKDEKSEVVTEDKLYQWIQKNADQVQYKESPFKFVEQLRENAAAYANFSNGQLLDGTPNTYLQNIRNLGGGSFSLHLILLLAAKGLDKENLELLAQKIEALLIYYNVTRKSTKDYERDFAKWAKQLKKISHSDNQRENLEKFINDVFVKEMKELKDRFEFSFLTLGINNIQSYKLKYILARIAQYVDDQKIGKRDISSLDSYIERLAEIEHILPNNPTKEQQEAFGTEDEYNEYKQKLGNLTLYEKPNNAFAGRKYFDKKQPGYATSKFYITKSLAGFDQVGQKTAITRINEKLEEFDEWTKDSIDRRQMMLYKLAQEIWPV